MANAETPDASHYYIPHHSPWPIVGSVALFTIMLGAITYLNDWGSGLGVPAGRRSSWRSCSSAGSRAVIDENQHGIYNLQVDRSFRMGMMWFIFSEVMFFGAFFGALFYARVLSVPWLGGEGVKVFTNYILWPQFEGTWPTNGPARVGGRRRHLQHHPGDRHPAAEHRDPADQRRHGHDRAPCAACRTARRLTIFLALTFLLGFTFVGFQAHEYGEAYQELGLRLSTGIYGSTFFMLTGFHGLHVTIGAIMLMVIWLRVLRGHFTPKRHFAFEAVAWYWHFVDVVWLGLFIFVYWL